MRQYQVPDVCWMMGSLRTTLYRLEIVLALAQRSQVGGYQVDVRDTVAQQNGFERL